MNTPPIVSPEEWEAARQELLVKEKAFTRARDALAAERRRMPWLAVETEYAFDGPGGRASLIDLFAGRRQLIVYRAFFEPGVSGWPEHACIGCSMVADQVAHVAHLNARDTTLVFASRAPQADIERVKARMGWEMPWYTMTDSFDTDFGVDDWHGTDAFIRDGDRVFRTYFINARGDEAMGSTWSYLDITALGRQEQWEDSPDGYPQTPPYEWWIWHDEPRHTDPDRPGRVTRPATVSTNGDDTERRTGNRKEWLQARLDLLTAEKELTRRNDEIARRRRELPWVRVEKDYLFDTADGEATLTGLFRGRSQLLVYHFMFDPDWDEGCPSCSSVADGFNQTHLHFQNHDVAFTVVSRAPLEKLLAYRERMAWSFPWASSGRTDFNYDYHVTIDPSVAPVEYNYCNQAQLEQADINWRDWSGEQPGMSAFTLDDNVVYHTYSAYTRGFDALWPMWQWLDRAPLGRNEGDFSWFGRHDEYDGSYR